jgi:uncharacterized protein YndB with AHSA1/START domain
MSEPTPSTPSTAAQSINLVVRRTIRASAQRLFDAWTRPEQLLKWWGPAHVECAGAEVDLRVGGQYRIGNRLPDGQVLWIAGEFEEVAPPRRLVYTWRLGPRAGDPERVTVRFEPREGGTEVIVVHERLLDQSVRDQHERGWIGCLDGLEAYLRAVG